MPETRDRQANELFSHFAGRSVRVTLQLGEELGILSFDTVIDHVTPLENDGYLIQIDKGSFLIPHGTIVSSSPAHFIIRGEHWSLVVTRWRGPEPYPDASYKTQQI